MPSRFPLKLQELGISVSAVLRRAGLPPDLFQQPRVLVTTEELFAFWRAVGDLSTNPALGLALGTETKTEHFTPSALAALSAENFGEAVQQIARYKRLTCPEEVVQQRDDEEWSIQFRWTLATIIEPKVLVDTVFAWVLSVARLGTGTRVSPLRVELVEPRPYAKTMEQHFGCPIVCGAIQNAMVFPASDVKREFITRNAELLAVLAPQLDEELKQQGNEPEDFAESVRKEIQQKLTGRRPNVGDVARSLHVSSRTLQRRLQEAGYSFQRVLEEARHQLARHYLNNSVLDLNEAAYLLGYEDANSFVRAFRTWEGIPPARWREQQRANAAS